MKKNAVRLSRVERALGNPSNLQIRPDPEEFAGGRRCAICNGWVTHAYVIDRISGEAEGIVHYVGIRCAVTVMAWYTGSLKKAVDSDN